MIDISLNNIEKYYGANQVLENVSFEIHSNDRIGIVGKNGCGKSTLFKIITEEEPYDKGNFSKRKGIKIGYLLQDNSIYNELKVEKLLYEGFKEINEIKNQWICFYLNFENNIEEYGKLQEHYEKLGGYTTEEKIKKW